MRDAMRRGATPFFPAESGKTGVAYLRASGKYLATGADIVAQRALFIF